MTVRIKEAWQQRKARRARVNEELARADQAVRQAWVDRDRGPDTEPWTPEMYARLWRQVELVKLDDLAAELGVDLHDDESA